MKKLSAIILTLAMLVTLSACNNDDNNDNSGDSNTNSTGTNADGNSGGGDSGGNSGIYSVDIRDTSNIYFYHNANKYGIGMTWGEIAAYNDLTYIDYTTELFEYWVDYAIEEYGEAQDPDFFTIPSGASRELYFVNTGGTNNHFEMTLSNWTDDEISLDDAIVTEFKLSGGRGIFDGITFAGGVTPDSVGADIRAAYGEPNEFSEGIWGVDAENAGVFYYSDAQEGGGWRNLWIELFVIEGANSSNMFARDDGILTFSVKTTKGD
jgi:hypothetical protein